MIYDVCRTQVPQQRCVGVLLPGRCASSRYNAEDAQMAGGDRWANHRSLAAGICMGRIVRISGGGIEARRNSGQLRTVAHRRIVGMADARKRGRALPYDFDNLLFFAWPVILPVYLLETRKLRIFLTLLFFLGVCLFALAGAFVGVVLNDVEME